MSVKSDKWIIRSSVTPTHVLYDAYGQRISTIAPPFTDSEREAIDNWNEELGTWKYSSKPYARECLPDEEEFTPVISPFFSSPVRYISKSTKSPCSQTFHDEFPDATMKVISFGTSSYGYDVRLANDPAHLRVFTNVFEPEIDPKNMRESNFATPLIHTDSNGAEYVLIPAHSYLQGPTVEYFNIPRDVLVIVLGKSTYARSAVICNVTPIEPEFEGEVVIEVANVTNSPIRCYLNEGIAQFIFLEGDEPCLLSYKDKLGKYQGQRGLTLAKV